MSDETTTAPAAESAAPAAEPTTAPETDPGLDAESIAALSTDDPGTPDTIRLGDVDVPLSALSDLPDDVLRKIKRKIKAAGEEREVSLFDALEAVPKAEGWQRRQWEAAQREKQLNAAAEAWKRDPIGATMKLYGVSRAEAVDILANPLVSELEEAQMSPEERAQRQRQRELEERARRADEYERREQEAKVQAETRRAQETHQREIGAAMQQVGLPESRHTVGRIAALLMGAMDDGIIRGDVGPEHYKWAAETVAQEIREERAPLLSDPKAFISAHPEEARAIARAYAEQVKARQTPPQRAPGTAPAQRNEKPKTWAEYFEQKNREMGIR